MSTPKCYRHPRYKGIRTPPDPECRWCWEIYAAAREAQLREATTERDQLRSWLRPILEEYVACQECDDCRLQPQCPAPEGTGLCSRARTAAMAHLGIEELT